MKRSKGRVKRGRRTPWPRRRASESEEEAVLAASAAARRREKGVVLG